MTVFRRDEFVRSVQGQSVPGSQVFVLTQPANVASYPPTPLASIYSDAAGTIPITQPMITDGFGHCDFYVAVGTYTIVVANNSIIQQVYTDQLIGQTGAGSISLQSNSIANTDQAVLNLKNGTYITVTPDGVGGVVIDTTVPVGAPVTLKTNGVSNTSQTILNLQSTDSSVTLTSDGSGNVNLKSAVGPPPSVAFSPFSTVGITTVEVDSQGANAMLVMNYLFIPYTITFSKFDLVVVGDNTTTLSDLGIYSINGAGTVGTKVASTGPLTGIASGTQTYSMVQGTVTLQPGRYLFCATCNSGSGSITYNAVSLEILDFEYSSGDTTTGGTLPATVNLTQTGPKILPGNYLNNLSPVIRLHT